MSLNLGILASSKAASGGGTDADAQAFFNRVTSAGGTLSATEQTAINTLTISLKSNSLWSLMKAIYPMVGASSAACAQNLKSSSFTGTFSANWTYTSAGVKGNGTSTFFNTNFNNQSNWTSTSNAAMGFISATNESGVICDMGSCPTALSGANSTTIYSRYNGSYYGGMNCTSVAPGTTNASSIGFFVTTRITTSAYSIYKRGSSTINLTTTDAIGTNPNTTIYLGAAHEGVNPALPSAKLYNFCFLGDGLTQTQIDTFYSCLQTFNSSLGR